MNAAPLEHRIAVASDGSPRLRCPLTGDALLHSPVHNKGTAFTQVERDELGIRGLLPPRVNTIEQQSARVMANHRAKTDELERHIHLAALLDRNETLFHRILSDHLEEMLPIVYTPTVGKACKAFGRIFRRGRGLHISIEDRGRVGRIFANRPFRDVRVIVVTDGERILGLGDLGANGMGIPIGKLALYVAGAGIPPWQVLPVCLDCGTDNAALLDDPFYLGMPHRRVRGPQYDALVEEFVRTVQAACPSALIQFEDFARDNALRLLDRYRDDVCCFNDDLQGTGAVALAAVLASQRLTGRSLADERLVIAGAGGAGIGIARQFASAAVASGLSRQDALRRIWMVDSQGAVVRGRDDLTPWKAQFAREGEPISLQAVVEAAKPTVLVGTTGQGGMFTPQVLSSLAARPLVLPLSNPTEKAECTSAQVRQARPDALVATGSPFPQTSQCNNVWIFPGIGLGVLASGATCVTDAMFLAAAAVPAAMVSDADLARGLLFPPVARLREVSARIAAAVARCAGVDCAIEQWEPNYLPYMRDEG